MRKKDYYTKKAKNQGYRARSAFKLKQIHKKYKLIKEGDRVLDLGCWPGGWSIICNNLGAKVTGVDLTSPKKVAGVEFIRDSVFSDKLLSLGKFDVVLSDLSPKKSGIKSLDQELAIELAERALFLATNLLEKKGTFLCKIFQGKGTDNFLKKIMESFREVKTIKPNASRKESTEMYVLAKNLISKK